MNILVLIKSDKPKLASSNSTLKADTYKLIEQLCRNSINFYGLLEIFTVYWFLIETNLINIIAQNNRMNIILSILIHFCIYETYIELYLERKSSSDSMNDLQWSNSVFEVFVVWFSKFGYHLFWEGTLFHGHLSICHWIRFRFAS